MISNTLCHRVIVSNHGKMSLDGTLDPWQNSIIELVIKSEDGIMVLYDRNQTTVLKVLAVINLGDLRSFDGRTKD